MSETELTPKQKLFCDKYLILLNATEAAKQAGYSEHTANEQGARLLAKVSVKEYLAKRFKKVNTRTEITIQSVLEGIHDLATNSTNENVKLKAYELEGKYLKMFTDRLEVTVDDSLSEQIKAARERSGVKAE